jgi:transcriptional regulator with XRE-family HTH domain
MAEVGGNQASGGGNQDARADLAREMRRLREEAGLSLRRLAALVRYSRPHVAEVEDPNKRLPSAMVVAAIDQAVNAGGRLTTLREQAHNDLVKRREALRVIAAGATGAIASKLATGGHDIHAAETLVNDILADDSRRLSLKQTTHNVDHCVKDLLLSSHARPGTLVTWMHADSSPTLRVNSAGILAKVADPALSDQVVRRLGTDGPLRERYLTAVLNRVSGMEWDVSATLAERMCSGRESPPMSADALASFAVEVRNPRDAGARWCSAFVLGLHRESEPGKAYPALDDALAVEESPEMRRAIGRAVSGRIMVC